MERIQEPHQLMDEIEQAKAYAASDFSLPHNEYVERFASLFPGFKSGEVLDIGVGHADIPMRFVSKYPETKVTGIDGSGTMLALGRDAVKLAGLDHQILLRHELLQEDMFLKGEFDVVMANSLLHHLEDPEVLWRTIKSVTKPDGIVYVVDLTRPHNTDEARRLVEAHSAGAPDLMRRDFYNSLLAAFTPEEIRQQLGSAGLSNLAVNQVSDRHVVVHGRLGAESKNGIPIRSIGEEDWRDYEVIRHEMLLSDPEAFPPQAFADLKSPEEKWRERIRGSDILLAYDNDVPAGMIRVTYHEATATLRNMYTNTSLRGKGVGKQLMSMAIDAAKKHHVVRLELEVEDSQIPALSMYEKFGFKEINTVPNERGGRMLTMRKEFEN